ncbi:glutamate decarboxylase [Terfezia boudieri ATCC MYA-4762]|uniref:Glutamate decarboxylase n=1 Tax=Terfezia boudieri ATCC MYA-4762 TaxID=1051890 RepID=A0A3N4LRU7_9PEZI|nr:glutamate decarboxylase [Terfezia boudieri ATCC MYA-4762]
MPDEGRGQDGLLKMLEKILKYSVNTWSEGFMDKLYASTNAPGVAAELILSVLNTNVHVYQVSPVLTLIEKAVARQFANLFGFGDVHSGGITLPGGSYSNSTSMIIARNTLYPDTKTKGNGVHRFVAFTSAHGHYSVEKAAIMCGLGSDSVWQIDVDKEGRMLIPEFEEAILRAKREGYTPFYVNAGAGTTVLGSYDPFVQIGQLCREHGLWFHVDGSWGGAVAFSEKLKYKLIGAEMADSLTVNPHKMLNVPVTCSFLLTRDTRVFHKANTLRAGYLFHSEVLNDEVYDMADLTLGCGRKGDSLKLALGWIYYGKKGYENKINHAFDVAAYFAQVLARSRNFYLVSSNPPPCLQVCFFYTPDGSLSNDASVNTLRTRTIAQHLIHDGFMVDYAPDVSRGDFFRAVINCQTSRDTIDRLVEAVQRHGKSGR